LIIGNNNVNIGSYSFIGSNSIVYFDILPYMSILFNSCSLNCFNLIGLKKKYVDKYVILRLKKIYKLILNSNFSIKEIIFLLLSKKYFSFESLLIVNFLLKYKKKYIFLKNT